MENIKHLLHHHIGCIVLYLGVEYTLTGCLWRKDKLHAFVVKDNVEKMVDYSLITLVFTGNCKEDVIDNAYEISELIEEGVDVFGLSNCQ